ncbi:hypothetical protein LPJ53_006021 [Coemansia erecta]|uniref:Uncharacterized protein n=1 Tax=Coemansia erecta TaxID=147472 RepID=A0A9W7XUD2_9FUNG|nr:hypothetical protein LPJ53_006021 [Coemansia erecta]
MTADDSARGRDKGQPTWEEVERTRTPLPRHPWPDSHSTWRLCIVDRFFTSTTDLASRSRPIKGRMRCLERIPSPSPSSSSSLSTPPSQSPSLLGKWQLVRVLGVQNIDKFTRRARATHQVSQSILEEAILDSGERKGMASVETLGQAAGRWTREFGGFCWRVVEPGVLMSKGMVESWRSGVQQRLFAMLWRDTVEMKGLRIVGRMAEVLDGMLEDALDDQPAKGSAAGKKEDGGAKSDRERKEKS